jgi:hypothetical protein
MEHPELHIKLPGGLSLERYEGIKLAVFSVLTLWDIDDALVHLEDCLELASGGQGSPSPPSLPQHP